MGIFSNIVGVLGEFFQLGGPTQTGLGVTLGQAPGTPPYNPTWFALTDVYWDPSNISGFASDNNSGATALLPVLTWAEIVRRYGSSSPTVTDGHSITFHKLSAQPNPATDPVFFSPLLSGGGKALLIDTLVVVAGAFACGAVTPKNRVTNTLLQVAGMPGGTVANQYVLNVTRGSYAFIDSVAGAVATMLQPVPAAVITAGSRPTTMSDANEDNTWTTGDTLIIYQCQALNLKGWNPRGGDASGGGSTCLGWVQWSRIVDTSGTGLSTYPHECEAGSNILSGCQIDPCLSVSTNSAATPNAPFFPWGAMLLGCRVNQQVFALGGEVAIYASGYAQGMVSTCDQLEIGGDTIAHNATSFRGFVNLHSYYSDGLVSLYTSLVYDVAYWGTGGTAVSPGGVFWNATGSTFALTLLSSGVLQLGNLTTGSYYSPGTGQWVGGIAINPTNLDTYGGLNDPQTGARFCLTNGLATLPLTPKVMTLGDSITAGTVTFDGGWPAAMAVALRQRQTNFEIIAQNSATYINLPLNAAGSSIAWNQGLSGATIASIAALVPTYVASAGAPDIFTIMLGTNDVIAGRTLLQMQTDTATLYAACIAANPKAIVVFVGSPPFVDGTVTHASLAAWNALMASYQAWLSGTFVPTNPPSLYSAAAQSITVGGHLTDGVHPSPQSQALIGENVAQFFLSSLIVTRTLDLLPRRFWQRPTAGAVKCVTLGTDTALCTAHAGFDPGSGSFTFALDLYPTALHAGNNTIATYGTIGGTDFWCILNVSGEFRIYWIGSASPIIAISVAGSESIGGYPGLIASKWNRIVLMADAVHGLVALYVNAQLAGIVTGVPGWAAGAHNLALGKEPVVTQGQEGYYSHVRAWHDVPALPGSLAALRAVERDYYDGSNMVPGASAADFALDSGLTDNVYAPGDPNPSFVLTGATLVARNTTVPARPWEYSGAGPGL